MQWQCSTQLQPKTAVEREMVFCILGLSYALHTIDFLKFNKAGDLGMPFKLPCLYRQHACVLLYVSYR